MKLDNIWKQPFQDPNINKSIAQLSYESMFQIIKTGEDFNFENDMTYRKSGCAALDLAYVASGRYDGFFQNNLNIWDIAAGIILVEEAGGILNKIDLSTKKNIKIIASSTNINEKLLKKLSNF